MFEFLRLKKKLTHSKILIVENEINIVKTLQHRLEANSYRVITASNGRDGLQKAMAEKPDIILLSIVMPIMNGLEMLEHLCKTDEVKDIAVIIVSARNDISDIARANTYGIDDYIVKPFDLDKMLEKIKNVLKNKRKVKSAKT